MRTLPLFACSCVGNFHLLHQVLQSFFLLLRFDTPFLHLVEILVDHLVDHSQSLPCQLQVLVMTGPLAALVARVVRLQGGLLLGRGHVFGGIKYRLWGHRPVKSIL